MCPHTNLVKIITKPTTTKKNSTKQTATNNEEVMLVGILICNHIYG